MSLQSTCGWSMNFCAHLKVRSTSGSADCSLYFLSQPAVVWSSHGSNDRGWFPELPKRSNLCPPANRTPQKLLASGIVENIWGWSDVRSNGPHSHKAHRSPEVLQGTSSRGFFDGIIWRTTFFFAQQRTRSGLTLLQMSLSTKDQNQIQHSFDIPITVAPNEIKNEYGYGEYSGMIHWCWFIKLPWGLPSNVDF